MSLARFFSYIAKVFGIPQFFYEWRLVLFSLFMLAAFVETVLRQVILKQNTSPLEIVSNVGSWLMELMLRAITAPLRALAYLGVASWIPWKLPVAPWTCLLAYLACDFIYYWKHRWMHEWPWLWPLHAPHHTSSRLHLLAGVRLGWIQRVVDDFFFLPLLLLGFEPVFLLAVVLLNEMYPGWCHSELIGRIPGVDQILNTPHNHRIHHGLNSHQSRSHYASTFMCWDQLFGTACGDDRPLGFGIEGFQETHNPLHQQFKLLLERITRKGGTPHENG